MKLETNWQWTEMSKIIKLKSNRYFEFYHRTHQIAHYTFGIYELTQDTTLDGGQNTHSFCRVKLQAANSLMHTRQLISYNSWNRMKREAQERSREENVLHYYLLLLQVRQRLRTTATRNRKRFSFLLKLRRHPHLAYTNTTDDATVLATIKQKKEKKCTANWNYCRW